MTDWIKHTTGRCPVDPDTVVDLRYRNPWMVSRYWHSRLSARSVEWRGRDITHYRIITPAKPPEPEMARRYDDAEAYAESQVRPEMNADAAAALKRRIADAYRAGEAATPITSHQPMDGHNLITLRLECLKLAVNDHFYEAGEPDYEKVADRFLHYVLNGSVDKA